MWGGGQFGHDEAALTNPSFPSVEVGFDEQCDITWYIPKGVESIPLFQTTSFNIERDSMDLIGGEDGKTFRFLVSYEGVSRGYNLEVLGRLGQEAGPELWGGL